MSAEQLIIHHEDNTMPDMDITWTWNPGMRYGFWQRDEHAEAVRCLAESGMLLVIEVEEVPW